MNWRVVVAPVVVLCAGMLGLQFAQSQPGSWVQTNGPTGGNVTALLVTSTGSILAGTEEGVFRSSDGGSSWKWMSTALISRGISNFARDSSGAVYVSTGGGSLYRSTDDGISWQGMQGPSAGSIYGLCCRDTSTLWVSTWGGGVRRTTDRGAHWQTLDSGLTMKYVPSLLVENGGLAFAGTITGVFRTTNNGAVWDSATSGIPASNIYALARHPGGSLFAITSFGAYRSTNNGTSWSKADAQYSRCMVIDAAGLIIMGMFSGDARRSTDGGSIWNSSPILPSLPIITLALSPSGVVYAGSGGTGVFRSTDKGVTWSNQREGFVASIVTALQRAPDNSVYAATDGSGLHRTTNAGLSWIPVSTAPLAAYKFNALAADDSGRILAGTWGEGIFRQSAADSSWQRLTYGYFYCIAAASGGKILAGNDVGKVLRSSNYGKTWTSDSVTNVGVLAVADGKDGFLYAGTAQNGVYRSSDSGRTWTPKSTGLASPYVRGLVVRPNGDILAATDNGVCRTTDRGETWTSVPTGLVSVRVLLPIGTTRMVAAGWKGVSFSSDGGVSWGLVNDGLWPPDVRSIAIDAGGYLYAGTANAGVFKSVAVTAVDDETASPVPLACVLWQNYPNPFNPSTTIRYDLPRTLPVKITVFDLLGREIALLVQEEQNVGSHEVRFDGRGLSSGVYLCQMRAGDFMQSRKVLLVR